MSYVFELDPKSTEQMLADARLSGNVVPIDVAQDDEGPGFFDNAIVGKEKGAMRGFARLGQVAAMLGAPLLRSNSPYMGDYRASEDPTQSPEALDPVFKAIDENVNDAVDYWTPDPTTTGMLGRMWGGLNESLVPLVVGAGNPAPLIATSQVGTSMDLVRKGVDAETAIAAGLVAGTATAAGVKLPSLGKTIGQQVFTGAVGNTAFGAAETLAQKEMLGGRGYDELAAQYDPLDIEGRTLDLLMGAAFGPASRMDSGQPMLTPSQRAAVVASQNARHFQVDTAPGRPMDATASVAHQEAMTRAIEQMDRGEPVTVDPRVFEQNFEARPERAAPDAETILDTVGEIPTAYAAPTRPPDQTGSSSPRDGDSLAPRRFSHSTGDGTVTYEHREDGRIFRTIRYDDGETFVNQLVTDSKGDEHWVTNAGYEKGNFFPMQVPKSELKALVDQDANSIGAELSPTDPKVIEARFAEQIDSDPEAAVAAYRALAETNGGKVINADLVRELSPDYLADRTRAAAVHEPSSKLTKELFARALKEAPAASEVVLAAGGAGSGKSTGLKMLGINDQVVFDGTLSKESGASRAIEQVLDAGHTAHVIYTYRDPMEAFRHGALSRAMREEGQFGTGRAVPMDAFVEGHKGARETIAKLMARYRNNPRVRFDVIDNSRGQGEARLVELEDLPATDYNGLREKLVPILEEQRASGAISERIYRGTRGQDDARQSRAADRGQPQQERAEQGSDAVEAYTSPHIEAARQLLAEQDVQLPTGEIDADGNPVTRSGREVLAQAEQDIATAEQESVKFEAAVSCFISRGVE